MLLQATLHPSTWMETSQSGNYVSTLTPIPFISGSILKCFLIPLLLSYLVLFLSSLSCV